MIPLCSESWCNFTFARALWCNFTFARVNFQKKKKSTNGDDEDEDDDEFRNLEPRRASSRLKIEFTIFFTLVLQKKRTIKTKYLSVDIIDNFTV